MHDFAKSPRRYHFEVVKTAAPAPRRISLPRFRWVLLLVVLAAVTYWRTHSGPAEAEADYAPGKTESAEYQEAVEQQEKEQEQQKQSHLAEQQRLTAALKEKLMNSTSTEPEFGFYDSLAGSSWSVPVQKGIYVTEEDRKRANQRYMLQAASVRDGAEAQRIVQKLRQLGMQAFYSHDETGGWYRINVGPFDNVSKMNKAEDILVSLRMMPLKRKI